MRRAARAPISEVRLAARACFAACFLFALLTILWPATWSGTAGGDAGEARLQPISWAAAGPVPVTGAQTRAETHRAPDAAVRLQSPLPDDPGSLPGAGLPLVDEPAAAWAPLATAKVTPGSLRVYSSRAPPGTA